jgi:AcrR family transcriptional regulator
MATPKRTPRPRGSRDGTFDDIVDRVTEEVTEKVSRKLDQVAAKTKAKIDAAQAKAEAKIGASGTKLERQQAKLDDRRKQHADAFERLAAHLDALEVWTRGAGTGRRPRFTRDEIAEAAVRIADAEGFEALSMRRLAAELEAGTMTLYHYIRTKDELLTLVNDAVMGEVVVPADEPLPKDWRAAITIIAERTRASIERHPWLLDLVDDPQIGPNAVRHFDQTMQAVAPLGASIEERLDIVTAVDEYVFGYCIHARHNMHPEHEGDDDYATGLVEYIEGLIATGDYPHLEELAGENSVGEVLQMAEEHSRDPGRFRRNLDRLLDGIEADVAKGRRRTRKRT